MNYRTIAVLLLTVMCAGNVSAQDDVGIMDLKETVYYLLQDVNDMKAGQQVSLKETKHISMKNVGIIEEVRNEVNALKTQNKILTDREILADFVVPEELNNYIK